MCPREDVFLMLNTKNPTTYQEQMTLLKTRGCIISDDEFCLKTLQSVNYYRLSAYFLPFKNADDSFKLGTEFSKIVDIYNFDRELRRILFSAIEEIEIFLRTQFSYFHAHRYGSTGYLCAENFSERHNAQKFKEHIDKEINNNKKVLFVKHHIEKYDGVFPIWVITELFTFGMLSYFYADLKTPDKKVLARQLYDTVPQNMTSYLRCVTDMRNIVAHYGRLYYRIFPAIPANIGVPETAKRKLWGAIQAVRLLYPNRQKWNEEIIPAMQKVFDFYASSIDLAHIAFPSDWAERIKNT